MEFSTVPTAPEGFVCADHLIAKLTCDSRVSERMSEARQKISAFVGQRESLGSLRLQAGLSQGELALSVGTSQPAISAYESGKREPSLKMAAKIAKVLGVDLAIVAKAVGA